MVDDPRYDGELTFIYEKGRQFRVVHVDGVIGSMSPGNALIHMSVFNERTPIPQKIVQQVTKGELGPELMDKRVVREGLFREVEADLVLTVEVAIAVRAWLDARIEEVQNARMLMQQHATEQGRGA